MEKNRTIFPIEWTKKDVVVAIGKTIKKAAMVGNEIPFAESAHTIEDTLENGMKIVIKICENKIFKTAYPAWKTSLFCLKRTVIP